MAPEGDLSREVKPKLPFWKTVGRSYSVFFSNIGTAVRGAWLWAVVIGAVAAVTSYVQFDAVRAFLETQPSPSTMPALPAKVQIISLFLNVVMLVGGASCAVMWHRFLLLAENPGLSGSNIASSYVWRYVWTLILILLIVVLVGSLFGAGVGSSQCLDRGRHIIPLWSRL